MMKQLLESRDRIFSYKTLINNDNIYTIKSFFLYLFFFILQSLEVCLKLINLWVIVTGIHSTSLYGCNYVAVRAQLRCIDYVKVLIQLYENNIIELDC